MLKTAGHWHCDECGPIPAMRHTPEKCPMCGRQIYFREDTAVKRYPTSDERAAEWFKKMREAIETPYDKEIPDSDSSAGLRGVDGR